MGTIIWGVAFLAFLFLEFVAPQVEWLFFSGGALITSLLSMLIPGLGEIWWLQGLIWASTSVGSLLLVRKFFPKAFLGRKRKEDPSDGAGDKALVIEAISPDTPGRIKYQGTSWTAISDVETIGVGETVEILEKKGMIFTVTAEIMEEFPEKELQQKKLEKQEDVNKEEN